MATALLLLHPILVQYFSKLLAAIIDTPMTEYI